MCDTSDVCTCMDPHSGAPGSRFFASATTVDSKAGAGSFMTSSFRGIWAQPARGENQQLRLEVGTLGGMDSFLF